MSGQKHCCATCRFLQDMEMSGNGWCTHPKRKISSDVKILVRKGELACRNSWGGSLWADAKGLAEGDDADSSVAAADSPSSRDSTPDQMWLPDTPMTKESPNTAPAPSEDMRLNQAAHLEQEDRAAVMRRSPRDAILRARIRSQERKLGFQRGQEGETELDSTSGPTDETAVDRVVAGAEVPPPDDVDVEATDREIHRDHRRDHAPNEAHSDADAADRVLRSSVPVSEVINRPGYVAEDKFLEVPDIQPDVELEGLRNQFSLPRQRIISPDRSGSQETGNDSSAYERALQRAREFRASTAPSIEDSAQDRVTASFTRSRPENELEAPHQREPDSEREHDRSQDQDARSISTRFIRNSREDIEDEDGDEDEVVRFQHDRSAVSDRFIAPVDYVDDVDDNVLEEDFELERTFRPEETARQSGHRWWHTIARHRVFKPVPDQHYAMTGDEDSVPVEDDVPLFDDGHRAEPNTTAVSPDPDLPTRFEIDWDSKVLASTIQHNEFADVRATSDQSWSSLDYLDDSDDINAPLERLRWVDVEPPVVDRKTQMYVPEMVDRAFHTSNPEGFERPFERNNEAVPVPAEHPQESRLIQTRRPMNRTRQGQSQATPPAPEDDAEYRQQTDRLEPENLPGRSRQDQEYTYDSEFNPDFDLRRIVAAEIEPPLDMRITISPQIPRQCATCRSFKPAENGAKGWCMNKWAFAHRPLVNAEDLACDSTIGCWWLPDEATGEPIELNAHLNAPTPRVDRLEARLRGERRRMTS